MSFDEPPELESETQYPEPIHKIYLSHAYLRALNKMLYEWKRSADQLPNGVHDLPEENRVYEFFKEVQESTKGKAPY